MKLSANLGFLWTGRPLPDAIHAAHRAGFDAVECHWPYATPPDAVTDALKETGFAMLGINTARGDVAAGDNGLAAVPGREAEARAAIAQAAEYASVIGAKNIHVMAGRAEGGEAEKVFLDNLAHAHELCAAKGIGVLIEPLNRHDAPGYFLRNTAHARGIIDTLALPGVKMMFDCYHAGRTEGDIIAQFTKHLPVIGHVQFASVPDRGAPDHGEVDYMEIFSAIKKAGWDKPLGAEYRPGDVPTEETLGWLAAAQAI